MRDVAFDSSPFTPPGVFGGGKQLVVNKTDGSGNLVVNVRTRIPFCIPNPDGTPSNDFDEFWMYNMNWLNPAYPAYPDDWPTSRMYDQYAADGSTPLCPCLYTNQTYSKTWVPNTTIQASDVRTTLGRDTNGNRVLKLATKGMTDIAIQESKRDFGHMMWGFIIDRDDNSNSYHVGVNYSGEDFTQWYVDFVQSIGYGNLSGVSSEYYGRMSPWTGSIDVNTQGGSYMPIDGDEFFEVFANGSGFVTDTHSSILGSHNYFDLNSNYWFNGMYQDTGTGNAYVDNEYKHRSWNFYSGHYITPYEGGTPIANNHWHQIYSWENDYAARIEQGSTHPTATQKNGYMPDFGCYGFGPRTSPPSDYISNMTANVYEDTVIPAGDDAHQIYDTYTNDNIRTLTWDKSSGSDQQMLPFIIKFFTGSTDPNDYFYNPYKLDLKNASGEISSGYERANFYNTSAGGSGESKSTSSSYLRIMGGGGNGAGELANGHIYIYGASTSERTAVALSTSYIDQNGTYTSIMGGGVYDTAEVSTGVMFRSISSGGTLGNINTLDVSIYGVKKI